MKHICHLTSVHKWNDVRIFEKECISLAEAGYKVSLIAVNCPAGPSNRVNIISVPAPPKGRLNRMITVVNNVYKAAKEIDADVYHLHDPELLRIAGRLKKLKKKVIYDSHEDLPRQILDKTWINPLMRSAIARIIERYEDNVISNLDGVITATPYICKRFLKKNKNTVDVNNYPISSKITMNPDWQSRKNEICYIGGIFASRGIIELLDALEHTDTRLNLAGSYSPESLREVLISKTGWKKVNEFGFADRNKINDILSRSKIGVVTLHPTRAYLHALPVKMFEYMAAGIPVIASDFPEWKKIIQKHNCGICVDPKDATALSEAINHLLSNESEAKQMGMNGRKAVEQEFSWENEKEKLLSFYKNIINQ